MELSTLERANAINAKMDTLKLASTGQVGVQFTREPTGENTILSDDAQERIRAIARDDISAQLAALNEEFAAL